MGEVAGVGVGMVVGVLSGFDIGCIWQTEIMDISGS